MDKLIIVLALVDLVAEIILWICLGAVRDAPATKLRCLIAALLRGVACCALLHLLRG